MSTAASPYWKGRIEPLTAPFKLRLLNGMTPPVPEATVMVTEVTRDTATQEYHLHLGEVLEVQQGEIRAATKPSHRERKSRQDVLLQISPALAGLVGPGNKSRKELVKLFWAYVADHKLQVEGEEDVVLRVDPALRALVGPKETVTMDEVLASVNENIKSAST